VFELFRKHSALGTDPLSAWWISDQGGPFPFLYSSNYTGYGSRYAGTMVQPFNLFKSSVSFELPDISPGTFQKFHPEEMGGKEGLTDNFNAEILDRNQSTVSFFNKFQQKFQSINGNIWNLGKRVNKDIYNAFFASEVIKQFKPRLTVLNMQDVDIGHSDFTAYCNNLHKADFATYKVWE